MTMLLIPKCDDTEVVADGSIPYMRKETGYRCV